MSTSYPRQRQGRAMANQYRVRPPKKIKANKGNRVCHWCKAFVSELPTARSTCSETSSWAFSRLRSRMRSNTTTVSFTEYQQWSASHRKQTVHLQLKEETEPGKDPAHNHDVVGQSPGPRGQSSVIPNGDVRSDPANHQPSSCSDGHPRMNNDVDGLTTLDIGAGHINEAGDPPGPGQHSALAVEEATIHPIQQLHDFR